MSEYTKATNFTAKDNLITGNPSKLIKGSEIDAELDAISAAIATKANTTVLDAKADITGETYSGTHNFTAAIVTVPSATAGDDSTKAASTAFVQDTVEQAAFQAALPAQTGNSGKVVTTDGTAASWSSMKTIGGSSLLGSGDIVTGISTVGATVTDNYTIATTTPTIWPVVTTAIGKSITALAANTAGMTKGLFAVIDNKANGYPVGFRDSTGTLIAAVAAGGVAHIYLEDTSTAAGTWRAVGSDLEPGLITIDNTFSSTYSSTVLKPFVALDDNKSIHFAALSSGFAAFCVDKTTGAVGTPVTVSSAAGVVPATAFRIDATRAIVFWRSSTNEYSCVVISLSGVTTLSVGTVKSHTDTNIITDEDFSGAPRIAQLSSTLFVLSYTTGTGGANYNAVEAISVSGTTITLGGSVTIITANCVASSHTIYALTATTALVLYKSGAGAPYANNAVVISVSGTTCTVGTPAALTNCSGSETTAPSSCYLSATKILVGDNSGTSNATVIPVTVSGTTVTAGTALNVETGFGLVGRMGYTIDSATRYNPHLWRISDTQAGMWYLVDSTGISRAVVLSESGGTVTAGAISYKSISWAAVNSAGFGAILPQGTSEFCSVVETQANTAGFWLQLLTNKISGTTISPGAVKPLRNILQLAPLSITAARLSSGDYVLLSAGANNASNASCIPVFRSNGDAINYRGEITCPAAGFAPAFPVPSVSANRVILLGAQSYGTTVGATTYQLRLLSVEICA